LTVKAGLHLNKSVVAMNTGVRIFEDVVKLSKVKTTVVYGWRKS
jgi:hypothetical protein